MKTLVCCIVFAIFATCSAFRSGAPVRACTTLTPNHSADPQTSPSPVRVVFSNKKVRPGETIYITLESINPSFQFRGYLIQPRSVVYPNNPVGTMQRVNPLCYAVIDCSGPTSATHAGFRRPMTSETVMWTAPLETVGVRVQ